MRYFAIINDERCGPYELEELAQAGVGPDTYVWCKGMADWEKAGDVADICRYFRRRVYDHTHGTPLQPSVNPTSVPQQAEVSTEDPYASVPLRFREAVRRSGQDAPAPVGEDTDINHPPANTMIISLALMLFCFPITGLVALYYSFQARRHWIESNRSETKGSRALYDDKERERLRRNAHDCDRQARMWIGISFFLGVIFYAFLGHKFF